MTLVIKNIAKTSKFWSFSFKRSQNVGEVDMS